MSRKNSAIVMRFLLLLFLKNKQFHDYQSQSTTMGARSAREGTDLVNLLQPPPFEVGFYGIGRVFQGACDKTVVACLQKLSPGERQSTMVGELVPLLALSSL